MAFTSKQRLFIDNYLTLWNATRAALKAGYSPKTAVVIGYENLRKPHIAEEIEKRLKASKMSADRALLLLSQQAEGTLAHFYDRDTGTLTLDSEEAGANFHLLKKVKMTRVILPMGVEKRTIEIELYDKQAALIQIGRHHGVFTDKTDNTLRIIDESAVIADLRRRVEAGELTREELLYATENDTTLADELFKGAAHRVSTGKTNPPG